MSFFNKRGTREIVDFMARAWKTQDGTMLVVRKLKNEHFVVLESKKMLKI